MSPKHGKVLWKLCTAVDVAEVNVSETACVTNGDTPVNAVDVGTGDAAPGIIELTLTVLELAALPAS